MPEFLVEAYRTKPDRAADVARVAGDGIGHVRSIFVPDDEVSFHLFTGPSLEALRSALELAGFAFERIAAAEGD